MLETTRLRYILLPRPDVSLHLLLASLLLRRPGERDVLRVGAERLQRSLERLGCGGIVEAEANPLSVVGRQVHRVEAGLGGGVAGEVVDHIPPQHEAAALLGEDELDLPAAATACVAAVHHQGRDARVLELPRVGLGAEVHVGQSAAHDHLGRGKAQVSSVGDRWF